MFAVFLFATSDKVNKCEKEEKERGQKDSPHARLEWWERFYRRRYVDAVCAGQADDVWVTLSGIAVAVFTFTLWRSTEKLWQSADAQRKADEGAREIESIRVERSLQLAAASANAAKQAAETATETLFALQAANRHAKDQVAVMNTQAKTLQYALKVEAPKLWIYGLGPIKAQLDSDEGIYYEISYKVANVGRAPAIIECVEECVQIDLNGQLCVPQSVPPWHPLRISPIIPINAVVDVAMTFPHNDIFVRGCHLPDSGGQEPDYFIPELNTDPAVLVNVAYRGAASDRDHFSIAWKFNREHNTWVKIED